MNPIFSAAIDVERFCNSQGWRFCFIGALAVIRWGEPRLTQDVEGIVVRQGEQLDAGVILDELAPLLGLKGTTEDLQRVERLLTRG